MAARPAACRSPPAPSRSSPPPTSSSRRSPPRARRSSTSRRARGCRQMRRRLLSAALAAALAFAPALASAEIKSQGGPTQVASTFNLATTGAATRLNLLNITLSPSSDTANIFEPFNVFVDLTGPGHANGEINHFHGNLTVESGALAAQAESFEAKLQNSGTVTEWDGALLIPQNNSGGTATRLYGAKCQLTQANASGGAVNTYACINNEAMTGGGTQPTANLFLRNADANAYIGTNGHINIGTLTDQGFPLFVQGSGATSGTFSFVVKNSSSANEFFCQDDTSCTAAGSLNVKGTLQVNGKAAVSPAAPTISSGFGTSPSITASNGTITFEVNVGTGGTATSGVIGLPAATTGWNCAATDITTNSATVFLTKQTASTTTTATFGNFNTSGAAAAWAASDKLRISCFAY